MNYGQLKDQVLQLLNKYSTRGKELTPTKTADIRLKIENFINTELLDLATTSGKLKANKTYVIKPVYNERGYDTSNIKTHLPGVDFAIERTGAQSYFFEAQGPATITIDENIDNSWINLKTIIIDSSQLEFAEYKGLLTPSDINNTVRLNFSGDYVFGFRNYILYPYSWPSEEQIQQHKPYFLFNLPVDYLDAEAIWINQGSSWLPYANYILDAANLQIGLNRYQEGEVLLNYFRKPTLITITDIDEVDDAQIIDATPDGAYALAIGVASLVTAKNDPATSAYLNNLYEIKKANMLVSHNSYNQSIISVNGW